MPTPRELLADLLRDARLEAGYGSHAALARKMNISRPQVSKAESASNPVPSDAVLAAWAGHTGVSLDKLTELANRAKSGTPEWFVPYRQAEAEATMIRSWGPLIVNGLEQTEAYARTVLSAYPYAPSQLDDLVTARMERQPVLQRAYVVAILDVGVLSRCMGNAAIMAEQCAYLAELGERPNIAIHIVPEHVNHGAWAAIDIASKDGLSTVSFSTGTDDVTSTSADRVERAIQGYERILGYAWSKPESLDFIRRQEDIWKDQI